MVKTPQKQADAELLARQFLRFHQFCEKEGLNFSVDERTLQICKELWPDKEYTDETDGTTQKRDKDWKDSAAEEDYPSNEWTKQSKIDDAQKKLRDFYQKSKEPPSDGAAESTPAPTATADPKDRATEIALRPSHTLEETAGSAPAIEPVQEPGSIPEYSRAPETNNTPVADYSHTPDASSQRGPISIASGSERLSTAPPLPPPSIIVENDSDLHTLAQRFDFALDWNKGAKPLGERGEADEIYFRSDPYGFEHDRTKGEYFVGKILLLEASSRFFGVLLPPVPNGPGLERLVFIAVKEEYEQKKRQFLGKYEADPKCMAKVPVLKNSDLLRLGFESRQNIKIEYVGYKVPAGGILKDYVVEDQAVEDEDFGHTVVKYEVVGDQVLGINRKSYTYRYRSRCCPETYALIKHTTNGNVGLISKSVGMNRYEPSFRQDMIDSLRKTGVPVPGRKVAKPRSLTYL